MSIESEHVSRSARAGPVAGVKSITDLRMDGKLPAALAGNFTSIGLGRIDVVDVDRGTITYRSREIRTGSVAVKLLAYGTSILAFRDGTLAYELDVRLETVRSVDLAGSRRGIVADPQLDPDSGELHLVTSSSDLPQMHVVVSRGALTRTIRSITNAQRRIRQLALTRDDVVFLTCGFVGVAARAGVEAKPQWFEIDTAGRTIAAAYGDGETAVLHTIGPSLVRWTLDRRAGTAHYEVLDPTPQVYAARNQRLLGSSQRFLWTVGAGAAHKHDLLTGERRVHEFGERVPDELVFVADPDRTSTEDGGWLIGFVHGDSSDETEFVVLDAEVIDRPPVATVHIPRHVSAGARGIWISATRP